MHKLSIIWKSALPDKMKWGFFQAMDVSDMHYDSTKMTMKNYHKRWHIYNYATYCIKPMLETTQYKNKSDLIGSFKKF